MADGEKAFELLRDVQVIEDGDAYEEQKHGADAVVDDFLKAMASDKATYINIYKEISGYRDKEYVNSYPADKYTYSELLKHLQENFGGGDYRIMVYGPGGLQKGGNKLVKIAHKVKPETGGNSDLSAVMQQMQRMSEQMVTLAQNRPQQESKSTMEMLQELQMMKEVMGVNQQPQVDPMQSFLANLAAFKEVSGLLGSNDNDPGFGSLVSMAGDLVKKAVDKEPQRLAPPNQPMPGPTTNQQHAINKQIRRNNPIKKQQDENDMQMQMALAALLNYAKNNTDPGDLMDLIFEAIPDQNVVKEFILKPDSIDHIIKIKSEFAEHKDWLLDLAEHVKACLGMDSKFEQEYSEHPNFKEETVNETETEEEPQLTPEVNSTIIDGESVQESANKDAGEES